jgi:hypothetical protein
MNADWILNTEVTEDAEGTEKRSEKDFSATSAFSAVSHGLPEYNKCV